MGTKTLDRHRVAAQISKKFTAFQVGLLLIRQILPNKYQKQIRKEEKWRNWCTRLVRNSPPQDRWKMSQSLMPQTLSSPPAIAPWLLSASLNHQTCCEETTQTKDPHVYWTRPTCWWKLINIPEPSFVCFFFARFFFQRFEKIYSI